jgi:phosphate/sulfate permease
MELYVVALGILFALAIMDLMVGVSNDAVNFLNSAVGSRVAPRHVIMLVASVGILLGVTFSSGMMEVARKGIFHPHLFTMPELIAIFLAVMLADVLLLDLFNTFGLPTSTTVSLIFGLLGAGVAVSLAKILQSGESAILLADYINTSKVMAIVAGILLSVGIAFCCGAAAQFASRLLFTFDFSRRLRRYGALWGGMALSLITFFILIKGARGASFMTAEMAAWIATHTWTILLACLLFFAVILQILMLITRINILKLSVLGGTLALAMSFAANDLVNFIGVPLAGFQAFMVARGAADPFNAPMDALRQPLGTNTYFLLVAGAIMVATLWLSRKVRTVSRTELSLGRQEEGLERFDSSHLSRIILRMAMSFFNVVRLAIPKTWQTWIRRRLDPAGYRPAPGYDGQIPDFDLLRASVNLMVSSALISWATSMTLPLSTTYVTFMVAMGSSLSDRAWGFESAVFRITGVLMVIGGWFFTALVAFTLALCFAFAIHYLGAVAIVALPFILIIVILRSLKIHGRREVAVKELELLDLKRVTNADFAIRTCFEHSGRYLAVVREELSTCIDGVLTQDRKSLKQLRRETSKIQKWSNTIVANIFKTLRLLQREQARRAGRYAQVISALQEIAESMRDLILRCHVHTSNQHAGLLPIQKKELQSVRKHVEALLADTSRIMLSGEPFKYREVAAHYVELKQLLDDLDRNQVERIRTGLSKTRLSILFYSINNNCLKISEQVLKLLTIFDETFPADETAPPAT